MRFFCLISIFSMIFLTTCLAETTTQDIPSAELQYQSRLIDALGNVALLFQVHPVRDLLQARSYFIKERLQSEQIAIKTRLTHLEAVGQQSAALRSPMAWELISMMPDARLYSVYTSADLGGYGDNNPPYEPSGPSPADGATGIPRQTVNLTWTGGDPDAGDVVYYDLYFGTSAVPPLFTSNLTMTSYTVTNLIPGSMYYWKIVARDNWDAETEGSIWTFRTIDNNAPATPVNPIPADGATEVDRDANLSWECNDPDSGDVLVFDVYFGTMNPPPLVASSLSTLTYDPGSMNGGVVYYWQIVASDNWGAETTGPVWQFTTTTGTNQPPYTPSNPYPANGATGVNTDVTLSWQSGDPDPGDTVSYDLYFGDTSSPPLEARNLMDSEYGVSGLELGRVYYWYVVARDSHSAETEGPLWNFVTYIEPTPTPSNPTPTPEPCVEYSVTLDMGSDYFCPGDTCFLDAIICNPEEPQYLPLWIILDIAGMYWFAPSWSDEIDYLISSPIPSGWSRVSILPTFIWPDIDNQYSGAVFWGALTTTDFHLLGTYDNHTFGWGPCY